MKARLALRAALLCYVLLQCAVTQAQLKADFSAGPVTGCSPLVVQFKDVSTGDPTEWKWDLGNGAISYLKDPSASYFNPGEYTVKLIITKGDETDSIVKTSIIKVAAKPEVLFKGSTTTGCYPLPVQFSDESLPGSGTITGWQWDFGDGLSSTEQHVGSSRVDLQACKLEYSIVSPK